MQNQEYISQLKLWCIFFNMLLNLKMDCNLSNNDDSKSMFFWRYRSFKPMILIRSHCQSFFQRMIIGKLCWRQWGNLLSDGKDHKNAFEHLRPEAWRKALRPGIFGFTRNWEKHRIELLASSCSHDHVLALDLPVMMTRISMIANIIYKDLQTWLEKDFVTIININFFTDLLYCRYKPESLTESGGIPIHQLF